MSRAAKATFFGAILLSGLTVYGVHYQQQAERDVRRRFPPTSLSSARWPVLLWLGAALSCLLSSRLRSVER
mgnify:CR=1 FL=1